MGWGVRVWPVAPLVVGTAHDDYVQANSQGCTRAVRAEGGAFCRPKNARFEA